VVNEAAAGEPQVVATGGVQGLASPANAAETVVNIKLNAGAQGCDGAPLTAKDFAYGIVRACDPANADPYQYILGAGVGDIKGCDELTGNKDEAQTAALYAAVGAEAIDDTTQALTLNRNVLNLTTLLSLWPTFPAREDIITAKGAAWTEPANIVSS